ncbi:MAG: hypothetical protein ABSG46_20175 [Candidatus Binataceae bacterium]|jgi:hypothetical protein
MTDAQASQHYIGPGSEQNAQSGQIANYDPDYVDDAAFGTGLRRGVESAPDGDNDTDDIGSYAPLNKSQGSPYYGGGAQPYYSGR